jgi:hypothetical protein
MGFLFCALMGTTSAIVFAIVYAAAIQVLAVGGVIFLVLVLGAFAGAIGGPVFGAAYWTIIVRREWSSRVRAALCGGILGGLIYAAIGFGYLAWEASARSHQPTKRLIGANPNAANPVGRREQVPYTGGVILATPDGGKVIEQPERSPDLGRSAISVFTTAGVTGAGGFLYGALFGAVFGSGRSMRRSDSENTEAQRTQSSG